MTLPIRFKLATVQTRTLCIAHKKGPVSRRTPEGRWTMSTTVFCVIKPIDPAEIGDRLELASAGWEEE